MPKFIRWKHVIVDGLTLHSEAIFPTLPVTNPCRGMLHKPQRFGKIVAIPVLAGLHQQYVRM